MSRGASEAPCNRLLLSPKEVYFIRGGDTPKLMAVDGGVNELLSLYAI